MRAVGVKSYSVALWKFRLTSSRFLPRLAVKPWRGRSWSGLRSSRHGVSRGRRHGQGIAAIRVTATPGSSARDKPCGNRYRHSAGQINVQMPRACRQASLQSAGTPLHQPEPFLTCGLDAAEPHIRSPLIAAGTKIPHTRGHRARKGTNLYRGILQPGRYPDAAAQLEKV